MSTQPETLNLPQSLGDGLRLRLAGPADVEAVAAFNERILIDAHDPPDLIAGWTRDLMAGHHPDAHVHDFAIVEDSRSGQIVSATALMRQTWHYDGIPFEVGRPELVATDPAYRRRGLVRAIFAVLHALSTQYGQLALGITGIPWFYRQFGYEFALPLGGNRRLPLAQVPARQEDEADLYQLRPATVADIPRLQHLYQRHCAGHLVTTVIDEAHWRYDLEGRGPSTGPTVETWCILDPSGRVIGYYKVSTFLWGNTIGVREFAVDEGVFLRAVLPVVLRAVQHHGQALVAQATQPVESLESIQFNLGSSHPLYEALDSKLGPLTPPYAWYVRLPDIPAFINHIKPVLEQRLADSVMSGYSGELKLTFYRGGLRLVFEAGRLLEAVDWQAPDTDQRWEGAGFPPLVFLQLLFGHRSLDELRYAFTDCRAGEEAALLLKALFPKKPSWVSPWG